ncbi:PREDICTED: THAP domain-containing protein 2-like [Cyphomyrmex costatus]|uniref:THAP domain-containing protein 2-like n=1 Tax=Cyphomyrmex costatus TaxID=456900 RepID=UPI000852402A|nr:PREDICTED: THAP domain-containing protein 2-like [Cyphomyrmex costatus]
MCFFPSDPVRRAVWVANVRRQNWLPNKYSALCEYHFGVDAFEKVRVDGTKKLRSNAITTIFGELDIQIPNQQKKTGNRYRSCSEKTSVATCCMRNYSSVPTHKCQDQEFVSINTFHERHIPVKEQNIMISVQKSVDAVHKSSEENKNYLQEERNISAAPTIVNTCTEENSLTKK